MPLHVNDLQPGDRVMLNCGASKVMAKREAQFEGIFQTIEEAMQREASDRAGSILLPGASAEFLAGGAFARFLFQRSNDLTVRFRRPDGSRVEVSNPAGTMDLVGAFRIEPDGALREEQGRRITIERRVRMGQG